MKPVVALVGRPNVGKSTLFNRLTRSRDALVADMPGLTRDRIYGNGRMGDRPYLVVDTGGLGSDQAGIEALAAEQTWIAVEESDATLLIVDGRAGLTAEDARIATRLRRTGKPVFLVVNKGEGLDAEGVAAEFHALGMGAPHVISAAHGTGVEELMGSALAGFPPAAETPESETDGVRLAVVGRPNAGKSTLINRLLGEERVLAFDEPGTTRDSVCIPFERKGTHYTLIDTAGVRRKSRMSEGIEKLSVIKTLRAIDDANVIILMLDAEAGVTELDASLLGLVLESGRALVIAVNKWDSADADERARIKQELDRRLSFVDFARIHFISALRGTRVAELFTSVDKAYASAMRKMETGELTRLLEKALATHQPPLVQGRRIKLRYAHQGGHNPPVIVIHGNRIVSVPESYKRYLANSFRSALKLTGTPLRLEFRSGENPYAGNPRD